MNHEKKAFGYIFDQSLKTLKSNLFLLVPSLIFYAIIGVLSLTISIPLMNSANSNPYLLFNRFESDPMSYIGAYLLAFFVMTSFAIFFESGNMYMVRNIIKGESNGLSDFLSGLTKYPHKILGFGLVLTLIFMVSYVIMIFLIIFAAKLAAFAAVLVGIAVFIALFFFVIVFQPYDAVMALGDNGAVDTIPATYKFGKSNFLSIFLLTFVIVVVTLLFQGASSVTRGVSSFNMNSSTFSDIKTAPFIIVYIIQMLVGLVLRVFSRIFKFHLYNENCDDFTSKEDDVILNDYTSSRLESNGSESSRIDITKSDDSNNGE